VLQSKEVFQTYG